MARERLSLKARALAWLAQRDQSRLELRRKLLRVAREPEHIADEPALEPEARVEALLDWLQSQRYLSEARFVESRIHARAARYGNLRIQQELARHGVAPDDSAREQLKASELSRAREVWRRKFGAAAADAAERAKQMRFLAQRGFSAEVIRRVVAGGEDD